MYIYNLQSNSKHFVTWISTKSYMEHLPRNGPLVLSINIRHVKSTLLDLKFKLNNNICNIVQKYMLYMYAISL